ncbi:LLM class flavin-dependent oxidoreductase [Microbacterium sp. Se63.02b]|uniref:LLM class flavin-dependent oxidoreductase n=1 Tax=Microbacterium sp. Se63.02b TaxID=2709304 RepID=UPI0031F6AC82
MAAPRCASRPCRRRRHPPAHRARGEGAGLDYLFFGDWLATGPDLEFRDPYLLARIDPVSAVLFLAGVTSRIGLIATVNTTYADPYTTARSLASLDVLTQGRAGVNLVTGAEPRAAGNHGRDAHADNEARYGRAEEFVEALRRLWDSWAEDAWVADADRGVLIDPEGLRSADLRGEHLRVSGPLNVARPPQGRIPIVHAGTSPRSRALAATAADLALIAAPTIAEAIATRRTLRDIAVEAGRSPDALKVIAPVLPVVADTDTAAHRIVERLLALVPLAEGHQSARTAFLRTARWTRSPTPSRCRPTTRCAPPLSTGR